MTDSLQRPSEAGAISALKQRVDKIERAIRGFGGFGQPELTYVLAGPVYPIIMPRKRVPEARRYHFVHVELTTPGSTSTTIQIRKNGTSVQTITHAAGIGAQRYDLTDPLIMIPQTDYVDVRIVTAGTGGDTITVDLWR